MGSIPGWYSVDNLANLACKLVNKFISAVIKSLRVFKFV